MRILLPFLGLILMGATSLFGSGCGDSSTNNGAGASGGGGPTGIQACLDWCAELNANSCPKVLPDCSEWCDNLLLSFTAACEAQVGTYATCMLPHAKTCDTKPDECNDEYDTLKTCTGANGCLVGACSQGMGMNGDETCGCEMLCFDKTYQTDCTTPTGGTMTCKCLVDSVEVGTCDNGNTPACGVLGSCCQADYFKIDYP